MIFALDEYILGAIPVLVDRAKKGEDIRIEIREIFSKVQEPSDLRRYARIIREYRDDDDGDDSLFKLKKSKPGIWVKIEAQTSKFAYILHYLAGRITDLEEDGLPRDLRILLLDDLASKKVIIKDTKKRDKLYGMIIGVTSSRIAPAINIKSDDKQRRNYRDIADKIGQKYGF